MLDFIYYPVSWILWFWHRAFSALPLLDKDSGATWALAVVFLVFTLRLVLYKPFVKQVRTTRQMQELQPQIKALQKKYSSDRQKMALEMQKLQREHGFNPLMGCLPVLAQAPVFIGLYHVLRSFNRTGHGVGQLGLDPVTNANTPNYVFNAADVQSFLSARIFGAPISAAINTPMTELQAFAAHGGVPSRTAIVAVSIPLMIIAGLATHFNARASIARQSEAAASNPQAALMNKMALWVFPLGVVAFGWLLPIAILLYWVANNIWTYGQQHLVFGMIEKEEAEKKAAALERRAQNAPKPGARPDMTKREKSVDVVLDDAESADPGSAPDAAKEKTNGSAPATPRPGQRPARAQKRPSGQRRPGNRGRANQRRR
ncbi:membrane protein insertase YidC [Skermania piniformis]|uniref:Membrane protein insertase YidC n=1 Tax=Skermania pinensis TaxID=39122 RepID=A0ABX8SA92_9ACTN|nr:membrane protein insertase YidC [Skermania piniformis]QXQ13909.1 membrane protein insertase YidC [Skermania piniformis]